MFLFLVWCVFFLFLPQSSNWPSFGYTFVSHISFTLMFQWSGAVYSTFAGYFLFFFVSILYMLICKANGWTGFGVMGFYWKVVPNRKWSFICMGLEKILQSSGLLFYHKRKWFQGPCPISRFRWREVSWNDFWCAASSKSWGVFLHFVTSKVKWRQEDTISQ